MKSAINGKIFSILLGLSLISVACVFPYVLTVQGEALQQVDISIPALFAIQFVQSAIMFSFAIFFGLVLAKKTGFGLPLLEAVTAGGDYRSVLKRIAAPSVLWGIAVAIAIYAADFLFTVAGAGITTHENYAPVWQKLLASVYGGITEEVLMRLFVMTLFIWIGMKLFRRDEPARITVIIAIILAAIIFGLGHLPVTAAITDITPLIVIRAIALNGIGGVVFGWLFWKRGLEAAMIAHFTTDIVLLTALPLMLS